MLHQKEVKRVRAYPTHQVVQTTGSTSQVSFALKQAEMGTPVVESALIHRC